MKTNHEKNAITGDNFNKILNIKQIIIKYMNVFIYVFSILYIYI